MRDTEVSPGYSFSCKEKKTDGAMVALNHFDWLNIQRKTSAFTKLSSGDSFFSIRHSGPKIYKHLCTFHHT